MTDKERVEEIKEIHNLYNKQQLTKGEVAELFSYIDHLEAELAACREALEDKNCPASRRE
jgi:hypothetical protein